MRIVLGVLAACVLAFSVTADDARAQSSYSNADLAELRQVFAAETPVSVMFSRGEVGLEAEAMRRLDRQAAWLVSHDGVRVRIYGIAAKSGYAPRNMAVAMKRANAVRRYLVSKGVDPSRLDSVVLFGNAPRPAFADAGAATVSEVSGLPMPFPGEAGSTS